jgi:HD-GYP domain-containing protein (c-di-GMP phosphodiesterase class II)
VTNVPDISNRPAVSDAQSLNSAVSRDRLQDIGKRLVNQLYVMLRTCRIYDQENENYTRQFGLLKERLAAAFNFTPSVTVRSVDGYIFFGEERLRLDVDGYLGSRYLQELFESAEISGFEFESIVPDSTLTKFFEIIASLPTTDESEQENSLSVAVESADLSGFRLVPVTTLESSIKKPTTTREKRLLAKRSFFGAINTVSEIVTQVSATKPVPMSRVKRMVHSLVDQILGDETYLLELTALKDFDDYTFVHSVNVSIYAMTMGLRLGLQRPELAELGFAAIFHDVGKLKIPKDLLNKPSKLDSSDWKQMHEHPTHGVKILGNSMPLDNHVARAMLVAFEHHKNLDGSGYPYVDRKSELNLHSRIVAICDFFDAITSGRKYQSDDVTVDWAFNELLKLSGSKYDKVLVKVFLNMIGVYPCGTLLLLNTGELALVIANNPEHLARPRVRIVADFTGLLESPRAVELAEPAADGDGFAKEIISVVDPDKYGICVAEFILSEDIDE